MNHPINIAPSAPVPIKSAVLLLVFNRPETTAQVLAAIRQARPSRLYVAADGARLHRQGEAEKVARVKAMINTVDWPCQVFTLYRDINLGCQIAPYEAISWFFQHETQGIILEDDCIPHQDFFLYCDELLDKYADDPRIWTITGDNFQNGVKRGDAAYYFSVYHHSWGWATWRRAWQHCDLSMKFWPEWKKSQAWKTFFNHPAVRIYWTLMFNRMARQEMDAWDYPWLATIWQHGGLTATPNVNLVSNIGFGEDSTHTRAAQSPLAAMKTQPLGTITHPSHIKPDIAADQFIFSCVYDGYRQGFLMSLLHIRHLALSTWRRIFT